MSTLFARGAAYLEGRRQGTNGGLPVAGPVTYSRTRPVQSGDSSIVLPANITMSTPVGGNVTVTLAINATVGKREYPSDTAGGNTITSSVWDFIAIISDFAAFWAIANAGTTFPSTPVNGDKFGIAANDGSENYDVETNNAKPYDPCFGPYGNSWRIHTRRVP